MYDNDNLLYAHARAREYYNVISRGPYTTTRTAVATWNALWSVGVAANEGVSTAGWRDKLMCTWRGWCRDGRGGFAVQRAKRPRLPAVAGKQLLAFCGVVSSSVFGREWVHGEHGRGSGRDRILSIPRYIQYGIVLWYHRVRMIEHYPGHVSGTRVSPLPVFDTQTWTRTRCIVVVPRDRQTRRKSQPICPYCVSESSYPRRWQSRR